MFSFINFMMGDVNLYMKCITWAEQLFKTYVAIYKEHFHNVRNKANDTLLYAFLTVVRSLFRSVEQLTHTSYIHTYKVYLWLEANTKFRTYKTLYNQHTNDTILCLVYFQPNSVSGRSQCCAHRQRIKGFSEVEILEIEFKELIKKIFFSLWGK